MTASAQPDSQNASVLDLLITLAKHRRLIVSLTLMATFIATVVCVFLPKYYLGVARILPPQQSQSSALLMLGQLTALPGLQSLGVKTPSDVFVGMLRSNAIADSIISRFNLKQIYNEDTLVDTREALHDETTVTAGKEGIITIEVLDREPQRAAEIANAFVEELTKLTQQLAISDGAQRRLFFERQLQTTKVDLANAEIDLRKTQETTGLIKIEEQAGAIIKFVAELKAHIAAREVQLAALRASSTEINPEFVRVQRELSGLRQELSKIESEKLSGDGSVFVPTGSVPKAGLEYLRKLREVKYQEAIFEIMAKQFEAAKVDEAKDTSIVQVLDRATPQDKKAKPKYAHIVILATLVGFLISVLLAFVLEHVRTLKATSEGSEQLITLGRLLRHWR
jgi:tyrosine-protein kinase Etk/Wzc